MMAGDGDEPLLRPGTKVRYDGLEDGGPEYGVVVHSWHCEEIGAADCYVAFFGEALPTGRPTQKPYVLRYAVRSLVVIED